MARIHPSIIITKLVVNNLVCQSRGPLVFLRIFLLRNAPAGNHQLVAEVLMEDGTISRISIAYSLRQGRRQPQTLEVKELQFVIVTVM
jgi:hypothetical protein